MTTLTSLKPITVKDLQLPFTMKGGVLIDLLVRLPPAFTFDCKEMPIDRSFHVVCHRHVIFDNLNSQNAQYSESA